MKPWKIALIAWVALWLVFLGRGLIKGGLEKIMILSRADLYEKNSYFMGSQLNAFVEACKREMPEEAAYAITGEIDEHNKYRIIYHLYPRLESKNPDYILNIYHKSAHYELRRLR